MVSKLLYIRMFFIMNLRIFKILSLSLDEARTFEFLTFCMISQLESNIECPLIIEQEPSLRALFLVLILLVVGKLSKILHVYWVIRYFFQLFKSLEIKLTSKVLAKSVEEPVVTVVPLLSRAI